MFHNEFRSLSIKVIGIDKGDDPESTMEYEFVVAYCEQGEQESKHVRISEG